MAKKALCLSEQSADDHLKQLHHSTIAIANSAPFAKSVTNILKAIGKRANPDILRVLERNSEVLSDVENGYATWLRKNSSRFNLTCFYEELELPPPVGMVRFR